jgi:peptidoglycan/xylan/chitin deacetylase (PgdA/CDA1 family)
LPVLHFLSLLMLWSAVEAPMAEAPVPPPRREVAITFDDLPATAGDLPVMQEVTASLTTALRQQRVPAIGFVNEAKLIVPGQIDARTALLTAWLDAGLDLGNHSFSHVAIDRTPLSAYQEDVIRGETITRALLRGRGRTLRYYRHTQLRTGPTDDYRRELDAFLRGRGYEVAPVTIDNDEYVFAAVYDRAKARGDDATMRAVRDAYLPYMERMFAFYEEASREYLGREVKQVLLLHANSLNADHIGALLSMMRRRGYNFVSLERALADPAYRLPEVTSPRGLSWLHRWRLAQGRAIKAEPQEPESIALLFRTYPGAAR